jgi:hypothetical protein
LLSSVLIESHSLSASTRGEGQGEVSNLSCSEGLAGVYLKFKQLKVPAIHRQSTLNHQLQKLDRTLRGMAGGQWVSEVAVNTRTNMRNGLSLSLMRVRSISKRSEERVTITDAFGHNPLVALRLHPCPFWPDSVRYCHRCARSPMIRSV